MTSNGTYGTGGAPAGWYPDPDPDPQGPAGQRYWDGAGWTEHTAPPSADAAAVPGQAPRGGSNRVLWIVLSLVIGIPVVLGIVGVIAAIVIPIFVSQQGKAEDTRAKADVATLGMHVAIWYVDNEGGPPPVTTSGGQYLVDHVVVAEVSPNVELGGITATGSTDWCVWVTNPNGDLKNWEYSAAGGLDQGSC